MTTESPDDDYGNDFEPGLLDRAIAICRGEKQRSVALLQRRLRLGYTLASDLLDVITERNLDEQSHS